MIDCIYLKNFDKIMCNGGKYAGADPGFSNRGGAKDCVHGAHIPRDGSSGVIDVILSCYHEPYLKTF